MTPGPGWGAPFSGWSSVRLSRSCCSRSASGPSVDSAGRSLNFRDSRPDPTGHSRRHLGRASCSARSPWAPSSSVAGLFLYAGIIQCIAGAFGGQGSFARLAYAKAAFTAPLTIVGGFVSLILFVNLCLALPLSVYSLALNLLALKAVNRFTWGWAAATIGVFVLISALFAVVLWLLLFRWIGPNLWSQLG